MSQPVPNGYAPVPPGYGPNRGQPDPAAAFLAGRRRRMVAGLLVVLAGLVPIMLSMLPLAARLSTDGAGWAVWTTLVACGVLLLAAVLLAQMNNPQVLREPGATRYARWTTWVGVSAGAVGVASSIVVLWVGRSDGWQAQWRDRPSGGLAWWSVTVAPGLLLVGTVLVALLGRATLRGLRAVPGGVIAARATEQDLAILRKAFDPRWRRQKRLSAVLVTTLVGAAGVGALVATVAGGQHLAVVGLSLLVVAGGCAGYAAVDVTTLPAVNRTRVAGVVMLVGMVGVAWAMGSWAVDLVLPVLCIILVVGTIDAAAWAVRRARRGVLGSQTAAWVAAQDAARAGSLQR